MSWIEKLYLTYEACSPSSSALAERPWPPSHIKKRAHVEVTLDQIGNFLRARNLERSESLTLIPATEKSAGRTAGDAPHPLCEELGYCAADLPGADPLRFSQYTDFLGEWVSSTPSSIKLKAIHAYVKQGRLWNDLSKNLHLPAFTENGKGQRTKVPDEKVFVRWSVEIPGIESSGTWDDESLIDAWQRFDASQNMRTGFCMVTGRPQRLSQNHPRFIRHSSDGGKLISTNDFNGYTFRGRFTDTDSSYEKQVCSVGFDVTQKAHSALRWLIERQGHRNGDQVFVAWEPAGKPIPDPFLSTFESFSGEAVDWTFDGGDGNTGQAFALRLKRAIAGYCAKLNPRDEVIVIGLDSATSGRTAITFYRELKGSEFLARIEAWHQHFAWRQDYADDCKFTGAPAPRDIAEAAHGRWQTDKKRMVVDEKLRNATVERLLPCIVDGRPLPADLLRSTVRRASNRAGIDSQAWEKCLGIACALFKGSFTEGSYHMALEQERTSRDYLFGRLLAIAEDIESYALYAAGEKSRDTTAARLMQRFADRPASTWRTIEPALRPYIARLRATRPGPLHKKETLLDEVTCLFKPEEFLKDTPLSGEFLLGYHCQRQALRPPSDPASDAAAETTTN
ncbi:type I-C CRISPR-associated protein Cas8c/Csd1 [Roseateles sp. LKC17W]|uniref:Type I-C CRISPR-associated protein Cas8c/Csd1 n=1 Tax=Pelomonas margarita TaxID=3299031 RepID=A0ABW7FN86_9BURK